MTKRIGAMAVALLAGALSLPRPVAAQIPDSLVAVSYQGQSRFRVNIDGGMLATGTYDGDGSDTGVPATGSGTRLMWYPRKGAFRVGGIGGTQWDAANIGDYSVAMGLDTRASANYTVAMGLRSTAAQTSSVAIGEDNTATGYASVALGYRAHTNLKRGSFVFGDNIAGGTADTIRAEFVGQALWRLSCGMQIYTNQARTAGVGIGGPATNSSVCTGGSSYWSQSNAMISTSTGAYLHTDGTWTNSSDVNRKHLFAPLDGEDVLARLRTVPITSWSYRSNTQGARHIGPTAQDFFRAFNLGSDSLAIATVDADGVALAGVKALEERTRAQAGRIATLEAENARLTASAAAQAARATELEARLARLEAAITAAAKP